MPRTPKAKGASPPSRRGGARPNAGRKPAGGLIRHWQVNVRLDQEHYLRLRTMAERATLSLPELFRRIVDAELARQGEAVPHETA